MPPKRKPVDLLPGYNNKRSRVVPVEKAKRGWGKQDYKWQQQNLETNMGHATERASTGTTKIVPPLDQRWTVIESQGIPLHILLEKLANDTIYTDILRTETSIEAAVTADATVTENRHFANKNMKYYGWSGMLQLEHTYPDMMETCQGFWTCLHEVWKSFTGKNTTTQQDVNRALMSLNVLVDRVFNNALGTKFSSYVTKVVNVMIIKHLKRTAFFTNLTQEKKANFARELALKIPEAVRASTKKNTDTRLISSLKRPREVNYVEIVDGARKLMRIVWGHDMDVSESISFTTPDQFYAAACLLELVCGSRMRGVMLVNWFRRFEGATMEEYKDAKPYTSSHHTIVMTRPSKEGSKTNRAYKEGVGVGRAQVDEEDVIDRTIMKPLNVVFLDPVFYGLPEPEEKVDGVDVFLELVRAVREYVFDDARDKGLDIQTMEKDEVEGLTDEQAEGLPEKRENNWIGAHVNKASDMAKRVFPFIGKGEGTHILRKIYVVWAYNWYASQTMKEAGFAQEVLGHRNFEVSLNYTSFIIKSPTTGDANWQTVLDRHITETDKWKETLLQKIDRLEKQQLRAVPVPTRIVHKRGIGTNQRLEEALAKIQELNENGIHWAARTLYKHGISTQKEHMHAMTNDDRYIKLYSERPPKN
jgi:CRISPR/Cas system CMR-associated protein Cmr5 small subunit